LPRMRGLFRIVENEDSESKSASRAAPLGRLGCLVMVMAICCVSAASLGRGFSSHSIVTKRCRGLPSWRPMSSVLHLQPGASSRSLASRIWRSLSFTRSRSVVASSSSSSGSSSHRAKLWQSERMRRSIRRSVLTREQTSKWGAHVHARR